MGKCPTIARGGWALLELTDALSVNVFIYLVFEERGKPENPEKNLSEKGREPTTNYTNIILALSKYFEQTQLVKTLGKGLNFLYLLLSFLNSPIFNCLGVAKETKAISLSNHNKLCCCQIFYGFSYFLSRNFRQ